MALDWIDRGCNDAELYRPQPLELVARLESLHQHEWSPTD
jgi:hypothetical protein